MSKVDLNSKNYERKHYSERWIDTIPAKGPMSKPAQRKAPRGQCPLDVSPKEEEGTLLYSSTISIYVALLASVLKLKLCLRIDRGSTWIRLRLSHDSVKLKKLSI
jgi:hypothetical protein